MWVGLIQFVEDLNRKRLTSPEEERILPIVFFWTQTAASILPWPSNLSAYTADFGLASLNDCMSQFPQINPPDMHTYSHKCIHTVTDTSFWFCFSGEHWLIQLRSLLVLFACDSCIKWNFFKSVLQPSLYTSLHLHLFSVLNLYPWRGITAIREMNIFKVFNIYLDCIKYHRALWLAPCIYNFWILIA